MKKYFTLLLFLFTLSFSFSQEIDIHFDHYAILVKDLDQSATFYMEVLGLKEIEDKTELPHIRWFSMGGNTELHVIEKKEYSLPDEKGIHFALKVNDLNAFIKKLKDHKVPFKNWFGLPGKTNTRPDGIRQVYFTDPSGYWIEVNGL